MSPLLGDRWVDANSGSEYTWIYDGNNYAWVEVSASGYAGYGIQGLIGETGPTGEPGQGFNYRGVYNGTTSYDYNDVVNYNGSTYVCFANGVVGNRPDISAFWLLFLERGSTGLQGFVGTQGLVGAQGLNGIQGVQGLLGTQGTLGAQGLQGNQGIQGPNAALVFDATPPISPLLGDRWVDSNSGIEYTYIYDGNNYAWVEVSASGFSGVQGLQGTTGNPGVQGSTGTQGTTGIQGSFGLQGTQGIVGAQGTYVVSDVKPSAPSTGNGWLNTNDGRLYIYNGSDWFEPYDNLAGIQGPQGLQGGGFNQLQGVQGPSGINGTNGTNGAQGATGTFNPNTAITGLYEVGNYLSSATSGTLTINATTSSVWYYTLASTSSFILNLTSSLGFSTTLSVGQSATIIVLNTTGAATTSYPTQIQVDGTTTGVTVRWQGGVTPSAGNASSIDSYSFVVMRTGVSTYTVLASQTRFA